MNHLLPFDLDYKMLILSAAFIGEENPYTWKIECSKANNEARTNGIRKTKFFFKQKYKIRHENIW